MDKLRKGRLTRERASSVATRCPLCSSELNEYPKGSATLFTCFNCGFKILTTRGLFSRCFKEEVSGQILTAD